MAHKHNRRRVRPRSRNNNTLNFSPSLYTNHHSFDSASLTSFDDSNSSFLGSIKSESPLPQHPLLSTGVVARNRHNQSLAWQNRDQKQKQEAAKIEAEQIHLFGGEPGDDVTLCYKMLEMFGGMDWVDT